MFNKLSPVTITNQKHRNLFIVAMLWFFIGAWIDASAHTYLLDDIESSDDDLEDYAELFN